MGMTSRNISILYPKIGKSGVKSNTGEIVMPYSYSNLLHGYHSIDAAYHMRHSYDKLLFNKKKLFTTRFIMFQDSGLLSPNVA